MGMVASGTVPSAADASPIDGSCPISDIGTLWCRLITASKSRNSPQDIDNYRDGLNGVERPVARALQWAWTPRWFKIAQAVSITAAERLHITERDLLFELYPIEAAGETPVQK
jgi:hypothetical protein